MSEFSMYQDSFRSPLTNDEIKSQIGHSLKNTDFSFLGEKYEGKVRDSYVSGDVRILITTDRLSCFDVVLTSIPFKGQVINQLAVDWLKKTEHIVTNSLVDVPHPNVMVVKNVDILPIEVVVRGYLAGSAWRDYQAGKTVSGIELPKGMKMSQQFAEPLLTPSTKAVKGEHDQPISEDELINSNIVDKKIWEEVSEKAMALFGLGQQSAAKAGLILVDTKYEFGLLNGKVVLADEIHTLDSSRYWIADTYEQRFNTGESPQMLDKEPTRQWLLAQGYKGSGKPPEFTEEHRIQIARHYISSYEQITGKVFEAQVDDVKTSLYKSLVKN